MYTNYNNIIEGLITKGGVSVDMDIASIEIEDTKFYLYATLDISDNEFDIFFGEKSNGRLVSVPTSKESDKLILTHLLESFPEEVKEEEENLFDPYKEYGISRESFINTNL